MSKYLKVSVSFINAKSLAKVLKEIFGDVEVSQNAKENTLKLHGYGRAKNPAAIKVSKAAVARKVGSSYGDMGFAWNEDKKSYEAILDDLDFRRPQFQKAWGDLKQGYTFQEVSRQARVQGYTVKKTAQEDGTVRVQLAR